MKVKKSMIVFVASVLLVAVAFLPAMVQSGNHRLVGPRLTSLDYEEIEFENGDLRLAGMLFSSEIGSAPPVAVIIHGSGPSFRDNTWYLSVAEHLQRNGIAVLLPDKRGSEKSEGNWIGVGFEDLATDTLAAVGYVRTRPEFEESVVGLIGMSQGGWIAPVAASQDSAIGYIVSMSGATVPTTRQLLHEEIHNLSAYTWPAIARVLAPITSNHILGMDHVRAYADFDPIPYWHQVESPKFFAFGGGDTNVPVDECLDALRRNKVGGAVRVYADGGHAISDPNNHRVSGEFLNDLVSFIERSSTG